MQLYNMQARVTNACGLFLYEEKLSGFLFYVENGIKGKRNDQWVISLRRGNTRGSPFGEGHFSSLHRYNERPLYMRNR